MKRPDITREKLIKTVVEAIFSVAKITVPPEKYGESLFKLGLDSLKAIQVINNIEDSLDVMIDDSELKNLVSINAIANFFESLPE
ncbi:MAG: acyl carrier protein [Candidatus Riflebacteria bacterium]|nr:acyl carrier protein [Candidatus Riflebacteria bacterium]